MIQFQIANRRAFLTRGLGALGVSAALPHYLARTALAAPQAEGGQQVLVVVQLSGGHDAISALVPYGHAEYHKLRTATRISDDEVIKINNELGLHPQLAGFKELLDQGAMAALPGVGYPNPNYSHFTATDIWHTARYDAKQEPLGWIGRVLDCGHKDDRDPTISIAVGTGKSPRVMVGRHHPGVAFNRVDLYRYTGDRGDQTRLAAYRRLNEPGAAAPTDSLSFIAATSAQANASSERVRQLAGAYKPQVQYPRTGLGQNLQIIASLIAGGLSTRIFFTETGGFDTHRGQRARHDRLMSDLNGAIAAFQKDLSLQGHAQRVLTVTTSEFGRRVQENGTEGTDHGAASAQFMFGPGVKPGIHGAHPSLTDLQGGGGGSLKHTTDFRSVYATVIEKWLGISSQAVLGEKFALVDCIA